MAMLKKPRRAIWWFGPTRSGQYAGKHADVFHPSRPKPSPPGHLPEPELHHHPPHRLMLDAQRLRHHPGRHQWLHHDQLNEIR